MVGCCVTPGVCPGSMAPNTNTMHCAGWYTWRARAARGDADGPAAGRALQGDFGGAEGDRPAGEGQHTAARVAGCCVVPCAHKTPRQTIDTAAAWAGRICRALLSPTSNSPPIAAAQRLTCARDLHPSFRITPAHARTCGQADCEAKGARTEELQAEVRELSQQVASLEQAVATQGSAKAALEGDLAGARSELRARCGGHRVPARRCLLYSCCDVAGKALASGCM